MDSRRLLRILQARPRLSGSLLFGLAVHALLPQALVAQPGSRWLVGWVACTLLYLLLAAPMVLESDATRIEHQALKQQEGRFLVLLLVVVAACAVLVAIASQLAAVKAMPGPERAGHLALAAATILCSWTFTQTLFAIHYAHEFYVARAHHRPDVLVFPGTREPDYGDFLYFACVIGTSGQTADVAFTDSALRRTGTVHCVLAFFFNTTVLALTINIAAGLF